MGTTQTAQEIMRDADIAYEAVYEVYSQAAGTYRAHSKDDAAIAAFRAAKVAKTEAETARSAAYKVAYALEDAAK